MDQDGDVNREAGDSESSPVQPSPLQSTVHRQSSERIEGEKEPGILRDKPEALRDGGGAVTGHWYVPLRRLTPFGEVDQAEDPRDGADRNHQEVHQRRDNS